MDVGDGEALAVIVGDGVRIKPGMGVEKLLQEDSNTKNNGMKVFNGCILLFIIELSGGIPYRNVYREHDPSKKSCGGVHHLK